MYVSEGLSCFFPHKVLVAGLVTLLVGIIILSLRMQVLVCSDLELILCFPDEMIKYFSHKHNWQVPVAGE